MKYNPTAVLHPVFVAKVRAAAWLARLESIKTRETARRYVENRNGRAVLRVDYSPAAGLTVWADSCRDITPQIVPAIRRPERAQ